jgi:DNA-binding Lrp family transcriptional regulator
MDKILSLLENDAKLTTDQLAAMLGKTDAEIRAEIEAYERAGVIKGYKALIDWDKAGRDSITAVIEVKVTPQRDFGFEQVAERIMQFDEVSSCYLMSGGFDLLVMVEGASFKEVAMFVAERLAPLDNVLSTATHFVLRKYKDKGVMFGAEQPDERGKISLC